MWNRRSWRSTIGTLARQLCWSVKQCQSQCVHDAFRCLWACFCVNAVHALIRRDRIAFVIQCSLVLHELCVLRTVDTNVFPGNPIRLHNVLAWSLARYRINSSCVLEIWFLHRLRAATLETHFVALRLRTANPCIMVLFAALMAGNALRWALWLVHMLCMTAVLTAICDIRVVLLLTECAATVDSNRTRTQKKLNRN